jgi:hypothetical protein
MPWGTFKLSQLKLDQQNIRTGNQPDQRAAIRALVEEQKQMIVNLALDLMDVGPSPGEPIWVTADTDEAGQHVVLEGNRRVAALKMLDSPQLAADTDFAAEFASMAKEFALKPRRELEAQIFASRDDAWPWIERRHMSAASGVGLQPWSSLALERQKLAGGGSIRRSLLVLNYLDDGSSAFEEVGSVINAKATTVDRVLNAPALSEALGVHISRKNRSVTFENGDQVAGRRLLRDLITAMAKPDFSFGKIRDADARDAFVRDFSDRAVKGTGGAPAPTAPTGSATVVPFPGQAPRSRLTEPVRPTLAPGGSRGIANVKGKRLKQLYRECRQIKLVDNENAAALLLRVFIELSSEALLTEKQTPVPAGLGKRGITDWCEFGVSLRDKVTAVLAVVDTTPKAKQQLQKTRVALDPTSNAVGSITTLNGYFHNLDMNPTVVALREAWDTWENYLHLLHAARV